MSDNETHDAVNHPAHYTAHPSGVECIEITRHLSFDIGNAVKYIWRADLKNGTEDLEKALWYLEDHFANAATIVSTEEVYGGEVVREYRNGSRIVVSEIVQIRANQVALHEAEAYGAQSARAVFFFVLARGWVDEMREAARVMVKEAA
ncbi:DUF3310 domain-containing protein [Gordonia sp. N1V]|uniref:DUF3310 domain-containing protein n=1 Tax=Gordonia sp. N1V TaxID=3034163 RepID=UPI0023E22152|nr:DUF3310 domain-containing protein [Gordonia sp. N1V]MDF3280879.1 DUF3310 domain-containing protein [Gordonia sp. N1V]